MKRWHEMDELTLNGALDLSDFNGVDLTSARNESTSTNERFLRKKIMKKFIRNFETFFQIILPSW